MIQPVAVNVNPPVGVIAEVINPITPALSANEDTVKPVVVLFINLRVFYIFKYKLKNIYKK